MASDPNVSQMNLAVSSMSERSPLGFGIRSAGHRTKNNMSGPPYSHDTPGWSSNRGQVCAGSLSHFACRRVGYSCKSDEFRCEHDGDADCRWRLINPPALVVGG